MTSPRPSRLALASLGLTGALALTATTALVVPAISDSAYAETGFVVDEEQVASIDHLPGHEGSDLRTGVEGGAGYRIEVPENWNGTLVLYAHGYRGNVPRLTVDAPPNRQDLLDRGYAWAASSYSTNGYDVGTAVKDTRALQRLFDREVAKPDRTYVMGVSMGGHVTGVYAEKYHSKVDGALPFCGALGARELPAYLTSNSLVAQTLAGIDTLSQEYPATSGYYTSTLPELREHFGGGTTTDPDTGATVFADLTEHGEKLRAVVEHMSGGERPLFEMAYEKQWNDFLIQQLRTDPDFGFGTESVVDNTDLVYQLDRDPALSDEEVELNENVLRVAGDPKDAPGHPEVTGDLRVPTISTHDIGDLFVPFSMEQYYAQDAADHGKSDLLVSRAIRSISHCGFYPAEYTAALDDLDEWVDGGEKPDGDDILDPETVAAEDFGMDHSVVLRPYDPLYDPETPDFKPAD
ncbi:alpha/beta hydrolase family protein [Brevibacterium litoralis]|uniref:alpha/beta hydrolase family protein n=1 Tax=Brevibacterium litoralis TaxID=3138935 RepID=UPI0032EEFCE4